MLGLRDVLSNRRLAIIGFIVSLLANFRSILNLIGSIFDFLEITNLANKAWDAADRMAAPLWHEQILLVIGASCLLFLIWDIWLREFVESLNSSNTGGEENAVAKPVGFMLLKPPFHYEMNFDPDVNVQLVTSITYVPEGKTRPDTRIPVFYVKNLTGEILRNVEVQFAVNALPIESAVGSSARLSKYQAAIISDFIQIPSGIGVNSRILHKALSLAKSKDGKTSGSTYPYQLAVMSKIDFIDPYSEAEVKCNQVFAGVEIYFLAKLIGARMGTTETASIFCSIKGDSYPVQEFRITVIANSERFYSEVNGVPQNNRDDCKAGLKFDIVKVTSEDLPDSTTL